MRVEEGAASPAAIEIVNANGRAPVVLICEHASAHIPKIYAGLGVETEALSSHIAWDIGAGAVTRALSALLDAPAFIATHSRLLVDLNRPPHAASIMPERSELTPIPGNVDLTPDERRKRLAGYFHPFHDAIAAHLDERAAEGRATRLFSVHSFTRIYMGEIRTCDLGILFDRARQWGEELLAVLAEPGDLRVGANIPYTIGPEYDYAVPVHGDARGIDALLVEICNDLIADVDAASGMARRIAAALTSGATATGEA